MNKIGIAFIIIGIICVLCAASNDDYYTAMGEQYPLTNILLWVIIGIINCTVGYAILRRKNNEH